MYKSHVLVTFLQIYIYLTTIQGEIETLHHFMV